MDRPISCGDNVFTVVQVIRQDGSKEEVPIPSTSGGGMAVRGGSEIYIRRISEDPEIWEARQLMAIMGSVEQCPGAEKQNYDPWDEHCTCNYVAGRGLTKELAVRRMLIELHRNLESFWA